MRKNNKGSDSSTVVVVKDADDVDGIVGDRETAVEATGFRAIPDWTTNADTDRASRGRASNF